MTSQPGAGGDARAVEEARRLLRSRDLTREWAENEARRLEAVSRQDFEEAARIRDDNGPPHGTVLYEVELIAEYVLRWSDTVAAAQALEACYERGVPLASWEIKRDSLFTAVRSALTHRDEKEGG